MNQPAAVSHRFIVLDSLRGLCALSVVAFHLHLLNAISEWDFFRSAGLMVEFFFTLSGFVLAYRYAGEKMDGVGFKQFMISRSFRIFPLHLAMLLLFSLPLLADILGGAFTPYQGEQWLYQVLLLQAWLPDADPFAFNGPAWSISVEYYLYVLFGLLLWTTFRARQAVFTLMVVACAVCVWLGLDLSQSGGFRGLMCFFLGGMAYQAFARLQGIRLQPLLGTIIEVLLLIALYMVFAAQYPEKSFFASWAFALAIIVFSFEAGLVSKLLRHPACVNLGKWSFSIYLTHYALLYFMAFCFERFTPHYLQLKGEQTYISFGNAAADNALLLLIVALVLLISRWSYQEIELRGIRWGKRVQAMWIPKLNRSVAIKV